MNYLLRRYCHQDLAGIQGCVSSPARKNERARCNTLRNNKTAPGQLPPLRPRVLGIGGPPTGVTGQDAFTGSCDSRRDRGDALETDPNKRTDQGASLKSKSLVSADFIVPAAGVRANIITQAGFSRAEVNSEQAAADRRPFGPL